MSEQSDHTPASMNALIRHGPVIRFERGAAKERAEDALAVEAPLELRIGGISAAVLMRTPGHDRELVLGLLFAEGLITAATQAQLELQPSRAEVRLAANAQRLPASARRRFVTTSACGVCSQTELVSVLERFGRAPAGEAACRLERHVLMALPERLRRAQRAFHHTGGLHAAALCSAQGELRVCREDVGRHNAADKVLGHALTRGWLPARGHLLLLSGRASYELVAKAAALGVECVAAISAPSTLAVDLAERLGITLIGFLRPSHMNVYTHPERILTQGASSLP